MQAALAVCDSQAVSEWILAWLGQALVYGTVLAALTWALTRLSRRRVRPAVHAALWTVVLLKFLAPVGPPWSLSMASLCQNMSRSLPSEDDRHAGLSAIWAPSDAPVSPRAGTTGAAVAQSSVQLTRGNIRPRPLHWPTPLAGAYLIVVLSLLAVRAWRYRAFLARCRNLPPASRTTGDLVLRVCRRLGLRAAPSVRISNRGETPFVIGLFRPLLVLSRGQLERSDELQTVIVHEVAHLRRGDMLVRYLQWIAGTLLFFWPVVAWVNRRLDLAREHACDQWALSHGNLDAGEYARCLLSAAQAGRAPRLACHPVGMAANHNTIERRIDMILEPRHRQPNRPVWGALTCGLLLTWGAFALSGAAGATLAAEAENETWPATEEAVRDHAIQLYDLAAQRQAADLNHDGSLSYREKSTFLVGLAMQQPRAFIEEFPFADRDHNETLDVWEAYDAIRGITLIAYADRRPTAGPGALLDLEFYHLALDAQQWLLDKVTTDPSPADLANARAIVAMSYSPRAGHVRKLDHGGPERPGKRRCPPTDDRCRFQELEGSIAAIEAKLAVETDPVEVTRLQAMLVKLEGILAKLEST